MLRGIIVLAACLAAAGGVGCGGDDGDGVRAEPGAGAAPRTDGASAGDAAARRGVRLVLVGRFDEPLYVTAPPRDRRRIYVVERGGRIRVVRGGRTLETPFLDIGERVLAGGERGLLGLAFAPDHARSGLFYVYYTRRDGRETLVEYRRRDADHADQDSARVVFVHDDPEPNHNGGQLAFGPDGLLYVGTGDGGGGYDRHGPRGNAQSLASPLGKILRIDPRRRGDRPWTAPSSNPFAGRAGARPEIYAYGLRNPWRFSFDRATDDLVIGDVGQDAVEEIDFVRRGRGRGANFGWRPFEGRTRLAQEPAPGHVSPVITMTHDAGWCSITGGYVVRDPRLPALRGRYVFGDFCVGRIYRARLSAGRARAVAPVAGLPRVEGLSSFGEDALGRVYVTSLSGPVLRLAPR